jgi:hypothetical protein
MTNLELAHNPNTPPETLVNLSRHKDWSVRCEVARNRNTPAEALKILATDKVVAVRCWITYNPNATEEIFLMVRAYEKFKHLVLK